MQNDPKDFRTGIEVYDYLIEKCGVAIALNVANRYGGQLKTIPANLTAKTKMAEDIGEKAAQALIEWRGGEKFDFPLWKASAYANLQKQVRDIAKRTDLSDSEKAKRAGVTRRTILNHKRRNRQKLPLFDD